MGEKQTFVLNAPDVPDVAALHARRHRVRRRARATERHLALLSHGKRAALPVLAAVGLDDHLDVVGRRRLYHGHRLLRRVEGSDERRGGVERRQTDVRVERRASRRVGIIETAARAERDARRERKKSLRIGVHNANAVVWGPV